MRFLILFVLTLCAVHAAPRAPRGARSLLPAPRDLRKLLLEDPNINDDLDDDTDDDDQENGSNEISDSYDFLAIIAVIEDPNSHKPILIAQEIPLDMKTHVFAPDQDTYDELRQPATGSTTTPKLVDSTPKPKRASQPVTGLDTVKPQFGDVMPVGY